MINKKENKGFIIINPLLILCGAFSPSTSLLVFSRQTEESSIGTGNINHPQFQKCFLRVLDLIVEIIEGFSNIMTFGGLCRLIQIEIT